MKRLINTFVTLEIVETARRAGDSLKGSEKYKLALSAIFAQRWPILIDYLRLYPERLEGVLWSVRKSATFKDDENKWTVLLLAERGNAICRLLPDYALCHLTSRGGPSEPAQCSAVQCSISNHAIASAAT